MSEPKTLNPEAPIPVTLRAVDWNTILTVMADAPWRIAAPLIDAIRGQCMRFEQGELPGPVSAAEDKGTADAG